MIEIITSPICWVAVLLSAAGLLLYAALSRRGHPLIALAVQLAVLSLYLALAQGKIVDGFYYVAPMSVPLGCAVDGLLRARGGELVDLGGPGGSGLRPSGPCGCGLLRKSLLPQHVGPLVFIPHGGHLRPAPVVARPPIRRDPKLCAVVCDPGGVDLAACVEPPDRLQPAL